MRMLLARLWVDRSCVKDCQGLERIAARGFEGEAAMSGFALIENVRHREVDLEGWRR